MFFPAFLARVFGPATRPARPTNPRLRQCRRSTILRVEALEARTLCATAIAAAAPVPRPDEAPRAAQRAADHDPTNNPAGGQSLASGTNGPSQGAGNNARSTANVSAVNLTPTVSTVTGAASTPSNNGPAAPGNGAMIQALSSVSGNNPGQPPVARIAEASGEHNAAPTANPAPPTSQSPPARNDAAPTADRGMLAVSDSLSDSPFDLPILGYGLLDSDGRTSDGLDTLSGLASTPYPQGAPPSPGLPSGLELLGGPVGTARMGRGSESLQVSPVQLASRQAALAAMEALARVFGSGRPAEVNRQIEEPSLEPDAVVVEPSAGHEAMQQSEVAPAAGGDGGGD